MRLLDLNTDQNIKNFAYVLSCISDFIRTSTSRSVPASEEFIQACENPAQLAAQEMAFSSTEMKHTNVSPFRMLFLHRSGIMRPLFFKGEPESPEHRQKCAALVRAFLHINEIDAYSLSMPMWAAFSHGSPDVLNRQVRARDNPDRVEAIVVRACSRSKPNASAVLTSIIERKANGEFDRMGPGFEEQFFSRN